MAELAKRLEPHEGSTSPLGPAIPPLFVTASISSSYPGLMGVPGREADNCGKVCTPPDPHGGPWAAKNRHNMHRTGTTSQSHQNRSICNPHSTKFQLKINLEANHRSKTEKRHSKQPRIYQNSLQVRRNTTTAPREQMFRKQGTRFTKH